MAIEGLKEFQNGLNKFIEEAKDISEEEVRKGALGITLRGLIYKTPVDNGTARGNWNTSLNYKNTSHSNEVGINDGISKGQQKLGRFKLGETIYFTNSLPYIISLEFGSSKQAPNGMMRLTFQETINWFRKRKGKV